jgi:hypothetical protein
MDYHYQLLRTLYRQQNVLFYAWLSAKMVHLIIISVGITLVYTGKIHDGSLTTVAGVLSQMSVGSFAKHNQSRLDRQIRELMDRIE